MGAELFQKEDSKACSDSDHRGLKKVKAQLGAIIKDNFDYPHRALKNKGIVDSGCSRHMTGNKAYLAEFQDFNGGPVAFGGSKGYITGKGKIKTGKLDFEDVCFVKELQHFNLFSVSQMCDKKNKVLFTDSECLVFFNLENIVPSGGLACLIAKATTDESNKWHRRLGHVNFKNLNKLVKGNLVRGLPSKLFQNDHTCVACQKGKQHKASCKAKTVSSISHSLQLLHMDLFGPTSVRSLNHKTYCLVITDDFSRVLVTKPHNKTPYELLTGKIPIISYIKPFGCHVTILNTIDHLGKFAGKSDEGFLVGYSLQSKAFRVYNLETKRVEENLHITFLENKPNVAGKGPTWLFDLDYLTDSMNYHPVRSENQANLHAGQQEANQNAGTEDIIDAGDSEKEDESAQDCFVLPIWPSYSSTITPALKTDDKREGPREEEQVFMDELERLKRQEKEANEEAEALRKKFEQETENLVIQEGAAKTSSTNIFSTVSTPAKASSTNLVNTVSIPVSTASPHEGLSLSDPTNPEEDDSEIPPLEDIYQNSTDGIFTTSSYDDEGVEADFTNLETIMNVSPIPTSRIYSFHPTSLILGDPTSAVQTRSKLHKSFGAHAFVSYVQKQRRNNHKDFQHCLFACFLSQHEPKKISEALEDESWVDAMQEELLQFKIQKVWVLVDCLYGMDIEEMSSMGELTFFLGLQVKQKADGIFISQDKYVAEILKKFDFANVQVMTAKSMIGSLMYLTASVGLDIMFCKYVLVLGGVNFFSEIHLASANVKKQTIVATSTTEAGVYHFPVNTLTSKVFSFMVKKGKHFSGKVTPLFATMLVQPTQDKGASSDRPSEAQPTLSPAPTSEVPNEPQTDSSPAQTKTSGENLRDHSSSDKSISGNVGDMTLQSVYDLCLSLCAQVRSTEEHIEGTEEQIESTDGQRKVFRDDETIAKVLLNMSQAKAVSREKEKGCRSRSLIQLKVLEEMARLNTRRGGRFLAQQRIRGHQELTPQQESTENSNVTLLEVIFQDEILRIGTLWSWKLHVLQGVHTLVTETDSGRDSTMALEIDRFIKKILAELEPEE
ncbi:putative ribonuclease H-like domain-containing protein [Tanacetum coccineum]|uniref:Ribonuclease H-like domain-containing protein n=1 Tax=Tanacetum coccineum TaxID=301880 RepID=A0ABQ5CCI0_9ASTR